MQAWVIQFSFQIQASTLAPAPATTEGPAPPEVASPSSNSQTSPDMQVPELSNKASIITEEIEWSDKQRIIDAKIESISDKKNGVKLIRHDVAGSVLHLTLLCCLQLTH